MMIVVIYLLSAAVVNEKNGNLTAEKKKLLISTRNVFRKELLSLYNTNLDNPNEEMDLYTNKLETEIIDLIDNPTKPLCIKSEQTSIMNYINILLIITNYCRDFNDQKTIDAYITLIYAHLFYYYGDRTLVTFVNMKELMNNVIKNKVKFTTRYDYGINYRLKDTSFAFKADYGQYLLHTVNKEITLKDDYKEAFKHIISIIYYETILCYTDIMDICAYYKMFKFPYLFGDGNKPDKIETIVGDTLGKTFYMFYGGGAHGNMYKKMVEYVYK